MVQPKTTYIPELQNETSFNIYKLKATLKVKKKFLTKTINEADKEKGKLEKMLGTQETRLDSYEVLASVLTMKSKTEKINSLVDVLDERTMAFEEVLEECKMKYPQTEEECDFFLQGAAQHKLAYKGKVEVFWD